MKRLLILASLSLANCILSMPETETKIESKTLGRGPGASRQYSDDPVFPCNPSCVLEWKFIEKIPLAPGDSSKYLDSEGDTLVVRRGYTEDGRDYWFSRAEYDSLDLGDLVPGCKADPAIACQEQP